MTGHELTEDAGGYFCQKCGAGTDRELATPCRDLPTLDVHAALRTLAEIVLETSQVPGERALAERTLKYLKFGWRRSRIDSKRRSNELADARQKGWWNGIGF